MHAMTGGQLRSLAVTQSRRKRPVAWELPGQGRPGSELLSSRSRVRVAVGAQVRGLFATLAGEGGFTLTPDAARKAVAVLSHADGDHGPGSARRCWTRPPLARPAGSQPPPRRWIRPR